MKQKKYYLLIFFLLFSLFLSSCNKADFINGDKSLPQYIKDFSTVFAKQGLKLLYKPKILQPLPPPDKPYAIKEKEFPDSWVKNELQWRVNKDLYDYTNVLFYGNYILENTIDPSFKASSYSYFQKTIYRLYKLKSNITTLSQTITNSDFELIKTLDKAEDGPFPRNQLAKISDRFIVWSASSDVEAFNWSLWAFDVTNNELFNVYSYKDAEKEFRPMGVPSYNIISEKNILVIDLTVNSKEGTLMNKVIFYDLVSRKIIKEIGDSVYKRQYTFRWGLQIDLIDGCMYGERFYIDNNKNISGQYILSDIVKLNLNTFTEEVVFQRTPFRLLATSSLGKIALAPYINNYPFHDIWIWDTKEGKIECYLKVSLEGSINPLDDMKPYISFCNSTGFLYTNSSSQLLEERHTFFSLKENKAYYTTPIQFILDNGEFAIMKSVYDLFSTLPFDYPGKEEKLKGCKTYLIIKPE